MTVKVIMYHYIKKNPQQYEKNIKYLSEELFAQQLKYFVKNFDIIDLSDIENLDRFKNSNKQKVLLTFDDGYKDMIVHVAPLLRKLKIPGTFFLIGSVIKDKKFPMVNKIHLLLSQVNNVDKILEQIQLEYNTIRPKISSKSSELESFKSIYQKLAHAGRYDNAKTMFVKKFFQYYLDAEIANNIFDQIYKKLNCVDFEEIFDNYFLSINDIKEMANDGFNFGYHGYNHLHYEQKTYEEQEDDIKSSIKVFNEFNIYNKYSAFCYPYGSYNEFTLRLLNKFGVKLSFTCEVRDYDSNLDSRLKIPRFDTNDFINMR